VRRAEQEKKQAWVERERTLERRRKEDDLKRKVHEREEQQAHSAMEADKAFEIRTKEVARREAQRRLFMESQKEEVARLAADKAQSTARKIKRS